MERVLTTLWGPYIQFSLRLLDIHAPGEALILDFQSTMILGPKGKHSGEQKRRFQIKSNATTDYFRKKSMFKVDLDTNYQTLCSSRTFPESFQSLSLKSLSTFLACFNNICFTLNPGT